MLNNFEIGLKIEEGLMGFGACHSFNIPQVKNRNLRPRIEDWCASKKCGIIWSDVHQHLQTATKYLLL